MRLDRTYQLNFGGNTDFLNMLERERLESKKISKTNPSPASSITSFPTENAHVGPSDYVPWLQDRKWCYIRMEGTTFGNVPLNCEVKLEVWDSPNSAGVVIDAVRCAKLALDRGMGGALDRTLELFHEIAAAAIFRSRGARQNRGFHPQSTVRRQQSDGAACQSNDELVIFGLTISSSWGNGHATTGEASAGP